MVIYFYFIILFNVLVFGQEVDYDKLPKEFLDNAKLTTDQLIKKSGYPAQRHYVTTEDGYILLVHRIPNYDGRPVLLQHGLEDSSAGFILAGPESALGFVLYDAGYDVWLGNARGNRYSRNHTNLDPSGSEFWQFSWHEIGIYDLPAMIDYILNKTKQDKLHYIGHSQGTTAFFVMCSKIPQYNGKIKLMQAMAPVAYIDHMKGLMRVGTDNMDALEDQLIKKSGYPAQRHYVTTEDGYILLVHRIPNYDGRPVLLQHGLEDSSAGFILAGPESALGFVLYDAGYDVWLGNARGNRYSRNHTNLDPSGSEFWQFSWHEIGIYDLPAMIDYILNKTKQDKLHYIGHSQGTTAFFVMCSKIPQYNGKIKLMQAMAPVAYIDHMKGLMRVGTDNMDALEALVKLMHWYEYPPKELRGNDICKKYAALAVACRMYSGMAVGPNDRQINKTLIAIIHGHFPAGSSIYQFLHFGQVIRTGCFCEYDLGFLANKAKYGAAKPPKYDLSKVTAPVILHYALNDYFCHPIDVDRLRRELGNAIGKYQIPMKEFNHINYLYAIDVRTVLYNRMLKIMSQFETGTYESVIE